MPWQLTVYMGSEAFLSFMNLVQKLLKTHSERTPMCGLLFNGPTLMDVQETYNRNPQLGQTAHYLVKSISVPGLAVGSGYTFLGSDATHHS